jgi:transposase, IS6 family
VEGTRPGLTLPEATKAGDRCNKVHRRVKRLVRPRLGFGGFHTARRTLAGYEVMEMFRKGQVREIGGRDMRAQASFIAELFQVAA